MAESHRTVMGEILLDQHMAVEPSHFRNRKNTDGPKERVATGSTSPCATYARSLQSAVL